MRISGTIKNNLLPIAAIHDRYWAVEEGAGMLLLQQLGNIDARVHRQEFEARDHGGLDGEIAVEVHDGIAVVSIVGPMTKSPTSFEPGASTVIAKRQIRLAAHDDRVKAIIIRFDSPGGTVSGTQDLAQEVLEASKHKKVHAFVEDNCCSAAFWVASQANKIFATKTSLVGSIGVFTTLMDFTGHAEQEGIQVHLITSGGIKGAGAPGTPVEDELIAEVQGIVDEFTAHFLGAVAKGRRMSRSRVKDIADGRVFVGEKAVDVGLVDGIATFDEVFNALRGKRNRSQANANGGMRPVATTGLIQPANAESAWEYNVELSGAIIPDEISGDGGSLAGLTLSDEADTTLAAVSVLTARIAELKEDRRLEGRELSSKAVAHLTDVQSELARLNDEIAAVVAENPDPRQKLVQATLGARVEAARQNEPPIKSSA